MSSDNANQTTAVSAAASPGRPLSEDATTSVLATALELIESCGVSGLTVNGIAKASGVSRPAIYRRWSHPVAIALDAVLNIAEREIPGSADGDTLQMLHSHIKGMVRFLRGPHGRTITSILGLAQSDPELVALFRNRFLEARRSEGRKIIAKGVETGTFADSVDAELLIDLYAGPAYFRAMTSPECLTDQFADGLFRIVATAARPS